MAICFRVRFGLVNFGNQIKSSIRYNAVIIMMQLLIWQQLHKTEEVDYFKGSWICWTCLLLIPVVFSGSKFMRIFLWAYNQNILLRRLQAIQKMILITWWGLCLSYQHALTADIWFKDWGQIHYSLMWGKTLHTEKCSNFEQHERALDVNIASHNYLEKDEEYSAQTFWEITVIKLCLCFSVILRTLSSCRGWREFDSPKCKKVIMHRI